jgi:choline dehydrogenase-like flavoprotein
MIVGSGPAGVSAAFPLVESGLKVLMVDGGRRVAMSPPSKAFLEERSENPDHWKWMIGQDLYALKSQDAVSPKLRVPIYRSVFEDFGSVNQITTRDFMAIGSLAEGGLSVAWGCGVARLTGKELAEFPFSEPEIAPSYERVAKRIGVSGKHDDDLSEFFGLDRWASPAIPMDSLHSYLYGRYTKRRRELSSLRFRLGRSRLAVLSEDRPGRSHCNGSGNCLYGCERRAMYSAADELGLLKQHDNFHHESGLAVERIVSNQGCWSVNGLNLSSQERRSIRCRRVFLAAGTLATTRLALKALGLRRPVRLHSCSNAAFLLWLPRMFGIARTSSFGGAQLSFSIALRKEFSAYGSTFGTTGIPVSEFARHAPFRRRYGIDLLRSLMSSCLVGNLFLPGSLSCAQAALQKDGSLHIVGGSNDLIRDLMAEAARKLRKAYWKLGAVLLPNSFMVGRPGGDIHYGGTLPMRGRPGIGETNALGELSGLDGVHVVDGACLSTLSEKSHTLTIMANADRIARKVASAYFQRA